MIKKRDISIDILKFIGLSMIILAHTAMSNNLIMQIRSFDVPLMVLVSGILAVDSYKNESSYFCYLKKRISRLIIPTYIFLSIFFVVTYIFWGLKYYPFSLVQVIRTFLLIDGIGYVWIIRVYILCSMIIPILIIFNEKAEEKTYYSLLIIIYIFYEIIYYFNILNNNIIFEYLIFYIIPYGVIMGLGIKLKRMSKKHIMILSIVFISIFIFIAFLLNFKLSGFIKTSTMKYPPRIYYLSYAIGVSLVLYLICSLEKVKVFLENPFIKFVSSSSMWIYLWHILYLKIIEWYLGDYFHWGINFIIIYFFSAITVFIQNKVVDNIKANNKNNRIIKYFKG